MKGEHINKVKRKYFDFSNEGKRVPNHLNKYLDPNKLYFHIEKFRKESNEELVHASVIEMNRKMT